MIVSQIWNSYELSALQLSCATAIFYVVRPIPIFRMKNGAYGLCLIGWKYNGAKLYFSWSYMIVSMISILPNYLHHTSAMPHPFLLLIAPNLTLAGCLGWKWSLLSVATWLTVQLSKAFFFLALHVIINDMKDFWIVCIIPQPFHSHSCCWLLPIWPSLDYWAENGAYGLCRLGWHNNAIKNKNCCGTAEV